MTIKEIEQSYGVCGLVCALCSYNTNCVGCEYKGDNCDVKACCQAKGLTHCFLCDAYPCDRDMHKGIRIRAFNTVAKNEGLHTLAEHLYNNFNNGIYYHKSDGLTGDYDKCKTESEVIELLKKGKPNPYDICPTYESRSFLLRLVAIEDAEDLLECYKNPTISVQGNAENCSYGYGSQTLEEMLDFIYRWLEEYQNLAFVRFSIIDKQIGKAVGTVEIFGGCHRGYSILRIDILSQYEKEENLSELLKIANSFFHDFKCEKIVTKAVPEATRWINSLTQNGYMPYPANNEWNRENYYIKRSPQNGA